jgi:hypothetical protein
MLSPFVQFEAPDLEALEQWAKESFSEAKRSPHPIQ